MNKVESENISFILNSQGEDDSYLFSYSGGGSTQVVVSNPEESFELSLRSIRSYDPVLYTELTCKMIMNWYL